MLVIIASSGFAIDYPVQTHGDSVDALSRYVAQYLDVPVGRQIFLSERGERIAKSKTFSHYGMSDAAADNCVVCLFDSDVAVRAADTSAAVDINADEECLGALPPQPEVVPFAHPLQNASSLLMRVIPQFLASFHTHAQYARTLDALAQRRALACDADAQKATNVARALVSFQRHTVQYHGNVRARVAAAAERLRDMRAAYAPMLDTFESDLRALGAVQLHASLQSPRCTTLLDCVPEAQMRAKRDACALALQKLDAQVADLDALMQQLDAEVAVCAHRAAFPESPSHTDLEVRIAHARTCAEQTAQVVGVLESDLYHADSYANELLAGGASAQSRSLGDTVASFEAADTSHTGGHLPAAMRACDELGQCVAQLRADVAAVRAHFIKCVRELARVTAAQATVHNLLHVLDTGMQRMPAFFAEAFGVCVDAAAAVGGDAAASSASPSPLIECTFLRRFPRAYAAALVEIARRRAYRHAIVQRCERFVGSVHDMHALECARRVEFARQHAPFLPLGFAAHTSWDDLPPPCAFGAAALEFDAHLSAIDAAELAAMPHALIVPSVESADAAAAPVASNAQKTDDVAALQRAVRELEAENARLRTEAAAVSLAVNAASSSASAAQLHAPQASTQHVRAPRAQRSLPTSPLAVAAATGARSVRSSVDLNASNNEFDEFVDDDSGVASTQVERVRADSPAYVEQRELDAARADAAELRVELARLQADYEEKVEQIVTRFLPAEQRARQLADELEAARTALHEWQQRAPATVTVTAAAAALSRSASGDDDLALSNAALRAELAETRERADAALATHLNDSEVLLEHARAALCRALDEQAADNGDGALLADGVRAPVALAEVAGRVRTVRSERDALARRAAELEHAASAHALIRAELERRHDELGADVRERVALDRFASDDLVLVHNLAGVGGVGGADFTVVHVSSTRAAGGGGAASRTLYVLARETLDALHQRGGGRGVNVWLCRVCEVQEQAPPQGAQLALASRRVALLCALCDELVRA